MTDHTNLERLNAWEPTIDKRYQEQGWEKPTFEHGKANKYGVTVRWPDNLEMGEYIDIGSGTQIFAHHGVKIGNHVQIGGGCLIYSLSTESLDGEHKPGKVVIEDGAQIGCGSIIMQGVTIGKGAFVTAGSLVVKDVPPQTVVSSLPPAQEVPKLTEKMRRARGLLDE